MACGLPVVSLNLGGPGELVDASCGKLVEVEGLDADAVVNKLADALQALAVDHAHVEQLRSGALARSQEYAWKKTVGKVWGERGLGYQAVIHHNTEEFYAHA